MSGDVEKKPEVGYPLWEKCIIEGREYLRIPPQKGSALPVARYLREEIRNHVPLSHLTLGSDYHFSWDAFLAKYEDVDTWDAIEEHAPDLKEQADKDVATLKAAYEDNIKKGVATFQDLIRYFEGFEASKAPLTYLALGGELQAATLDEVTLHTSLGSSFLYLSLASYIHCNGKVYQFRDSRKLYAFPGKKKLEDLLVWKPSQDEVERLTQRGRRYVDLTSKVCHLTCDSVLFVPSYWGQLKKFPMGGTQVIADPLGNFQEGDLEHFQEAMDNEAGDLQEDHYLYMSGIVECFSLRRKMWGYCRVDSLHDMVYQPELFDKLVLPEKSKWNIKAACDVQPQDQGLVRGKGSGAILLLSGPPGGGKTLTAECVAMVRSSPLYSLDMGELQVTSPSEMEKALSQVLDRAMRWNATLLFDEADVFLSQRGNDTVHNAMVAIFLRLLEYYEGVLFLTSNRPIHLDSAILSRTLLRLHYPKLDEAARKRVWKLNMELFGMESLLPEVDRLAGLPLNGREIQRSLLFAKRKQRIEGGMLVQALNGALEANQEADRANQEAAEASLTLNPAFCNLGRL